MRSAIQVLAAIALTVHAYGLTCLCGTGVGMREGCCCDAQEPIVVSPSREEVSAPCCCRDTAGSITALAAVIDDGPARSRQTLGFLVSSGALAHQHTDPIARSTRVWIRPPPRAPVYVDVLHLLI